MLSAHRILAYTLLSVLAVSLTVINALRNYSNFYSVAIYLSKSSRSVLVLANFGFLLALLCGHFVQRLFFGTLRPAEVEVCLFVIIVTIDLTTASVCMIVSGSSLLNPYSPLPYSEMNLTSHSRSCSAFSSLSSRFIGSQVIELNGYVSCL